VVVNVCQAGHGTHERMITPTDLGPFEVYHPERYRDTEGYCTGDDVLSRTLIEGRAWEHWETTAVRPLLRGGWFLDFGTHIGWFTVLAAQKGCRVLGFEADAENMELCLGNAQRNHVAHLVEVRHAWIEPGFPEVTLEGDGVVDVIKVDIEGQDQAAVEACWGLVEAGRVRSFLIEVSPCFSPGYPEMVEKLCAAGFVPHTLCPTVEPLRAKNRYEWVAQCNQVNLLFLQQGVAWGSL
jgi:hypothetical protein